MRLRLRMLWLFLSSLWREPLKLLDESVITLTVLPNDIDIFKVSNDRYISLMDLGRMDLVFRSEFINAMFRRKWAPVATFDTIRFRYPLKMFQKYQLRTKIIYWDDDALYFQQHFERKGRKLATGYVCATMLGKNGALLTKDIIAEFRQSLIKPEMPEIVLRLQELNAMIRQEQKEIAC